MSQSQEAEKIAENKARRFASRNNLSKYEEGVICREIKEAITSFSEAAVKEASAKIKILEGTIKADDERLLTAGQRVGIVLGCDTAEHMADEILDFRDKLNKLCACDMKAGYICSGHQPRSRERKV